MDGEDHGFFSSKSFWAPEIIDPPLPEVIFMVEEKEEDGITPTGAGGGEEGSSEGAAAAPPQPVPIPSATVLNPKGKAAQSPSQPPLKFIQGTINDGGMAEARRRWGITNRWRQEQDVDNILTIPQPDFDAIKEHYPHFCCGRAKCGSVCYYD